MSISSCFVWFFLSLLLTVSGFAVIHLPCFAPSSAGDLANGVFGGPWGWAAVHAVTTGALFLFSKMDSCRGLCWESERIKQPLCTDPHCLAHRLCGQVQSESESRSVMSDSLQPHELYSPWNSLGQNTGVGSLSLLQGIQTLQLTRSLRFNAPI